MSPVVLVILALSGLSGLVQGATNKRWGVLLSFALVGAAAFVMFKNQTTAETFLGALGSLSVGFSEAAAGRQLTN